MLTLPGRKLILKSPRESGKGEYGRSRFKYFTRTELSVIWIVTSWPEHAILFRYALNLFQSVCQQVRCMCCNIDGAGLKQFLRSSMDKTCY